MGAGRSLLITGGAGTFGSAVAGRVLTARFDEGRIFSRDEKTQDDMRRRLADPRHSVPRLRRHAQLAVRIRVRCPRQAPLGEPSMKRISQRNKK